VTDPGQAAAGIQARSVDEGATPAGGGAPSPARQPDWMAHLVGQLDQLAPEFFSRFLPP